MASQSRPNMVCDDCGHAWRARTERVPVRCPQCRSMALVVHTEPRVDDEQTSDPEAIREDAYVSQAFEAMWSPETPSPLFDGELRQFKAAKAKGSLGLGMMGGIVWVLYLFFENVLLLLLAAWLLTLAGVGFLAFLGLAGKSRRHMMVYIGRQVRGHNPSVSMASGALSRRAAMVAVLVMTVLSFTAYFFHPTLGHHWVLLAHGTILGLIVILGGFMALVGDL